ncbi:MAG TPA: 4a-hydroxytetrahydrobiopterin dehydratase [Thermoanaerobaculia bacterium]|nr:4a-hydroxytetrahydrobiopterin dehydratase [Thermoanaerobaculia bacterium]
MSDLAAKSCIPCKGGTPPLDGPAIAGLLARLGPEGNGWRAVALHHLEKEYAFPDFASALAFVNRVGAVAEEEGHHPDLYLTWGKVRISIWTHKIDGLTESDFVLAAKADRALAGS